MRFGMTTGAAALGMTIAFATMMACSKNKESEVKLAPVASALASSAPPAAARTMKFAIDANGTASIDMPAPKEHIKAEAQGAGGSLDVDLMNVASSRGEVKIDLTTLSTKTFGDKRDATQTAHARTWLEVADGEDGKLEEATKTANRYAVYAIRSIDQVSAPDVTKVAPTKDGADDVRTVTLTTHGELLIHGHKAERGVELEVRFRYPAGARADKPSGLTIMTKKPLRVTLGEHDVKPRDGFGKLAKGAFNLLGTKVADTADITLDLKASPRS